MAQPIFICRLSLNFNNEGLLDWFKHYNTASDGHSLQQLISEKDYESIAIYWWILEQLSKFEDRNEVESSGKITLKFSYFKMKLGQNRQRITKVLLKIAQTFKIEVLINFDESVTVFVPKWLELQETRGGKREAKIQQSFSKEGTEVRDKSKEIRIKELRIKNTDAFDFESAYILYPLKKGKSNGFKTLAKTIKTENDLELLKQAIGNYKKETEINKTESKWIKHFSTFVNEWRDWIDFEPKRSSKISFENSRLDIIDDFNPQNVLAKIKEDEEKNGTKHA